MHFYPLLLWALQNLLLYSNQKRLGYHFQRLLSFFFFFSFFESVETVVYDCISPRLFKQHQKSSFNTPFQDQKTYFWDLKCPMLSNRCLLLRPPELNVQIASHTKSLSLCIPRKTRFGHRAHTVLLSDSF